MTADGVSLIAASDAKLISASHADPEAFATIFERHFTSINRYLRRRTERTVADELAAECFLIAFRRRKDYDTSRSTAKPWLFGIATNLLKAHRRQEHRALEAHARTDFDVSSSDPDAIDARIDAQARGPELAAALRSLKPDDRDALLLFALADLTYAEIADALGVPVGTVRSRIHRARHQVRELLPRHRTSS